MSGINEFRFIGSVYGDCALKSARNGTKIANFTMAVKTPFKSKGKCHFPIVTFGETAEKAIVLCRNGARVAVTGVLVSEDFVDADSGEAYARMYLYASEILRIAKPPKVSLNAGARRFADIAKSYPINPPKNIPQD